MKRYINWAKLLNPIVILIYGITCYYLANLARYGGINRRVPVIVLLGVLLLAWLVYSIYKIRNQEKSANHNLKFVKISRWWAYSATLMVLLITILTGFHIYESAIPYNGKLSWYIQEWRSERKVVFEQKNIYDNGLDGLVAAVDDEVNLPAELFISGEISLSFTNEGEMTEFYGNLYGRNDAGETESFLIFYDVNASDYIEIHLDNYLDATYDEHKLLQPLIDGLNNAPLTELLSETDNETYTLHYAGFQMRPDNFEPTYYYDENGVMQNVRSTHDIHVGYSFNIDSDNMASIESLHFVYYDPVAIEEFEAHEELKEAQAADPNYFSEDEIAIEHFLNEQHGFQLVMLDAMLGSRFYGLRETVDGGATWEMLNSDPFLGSTGVAAGLNFINEDLGFLILAHNGGANANLFRTGDGGQTFERVELPAVTVEQNDSEFEPFDFPETPYEEDGQLILYVNQGTDGDYLGNARALFSSNDEGKTFEFIAVQ